MTQNCLWFFPNKTEAWRELEPLEKAEEELRNKSTEEIMELKKKQDRLVVKKAHLWDHKVQLEKVISEVYE